MKLLFALLVGAAFASAAGPTAAGIAREIQDGGLDTTEAYRVRDLSLVREDVRVYFTEGVLIFGKPVSGRRLWAVFSATDVEGGDAEILLMPPHRSERQSLATFAKTPNLDEHFDSAIFVFTDNTSQELLSELKEKSSRKVPEIGLLLADRWNPIVRNIGLSLATRIVQDQLLANPEQFGLFFGALHGKELGNFDLVLDPRAREQVLVGQVTSRDGRSYFDIWTSFLGKAWRAGRRKPPEDEFPISDVRIEATMHPDLLLSTTTRMTITPTGAPDRAIALEISNGMKVLDATLDGKPVEIFSKDSLRANLLRGGINDGFLVVSQQPFEKGRKYELEVRAEGNVVTDAGNEVYFVGSRGNWYPSRGAGFSTFDMTFRFPKGLNLVATGEVQESRDDGEFHLVRRRTSSPIRFAAFNLGRYEKAEVARAGFKVEVYANRRLEQALQPKAREVIIVPPPQLPRMRRSQTEALSMNIPPVPINPLGRLQQLASEVTACMEFMTQNFGPPPLKTLTVSPIPGMFGQGFPGLLYLSTLAYVDPKSLPLTSRNSALQTFYTETLQAHEVAHQWWGNTVTSGSYQDDWIMEALANYSALMFLEKKKGRKALDTVMDDYRTHLLSKTPEGKTVESSGPIVWGQRLRNSLNPEGWRAITYEKGSWIIHMLRARLGDEQFLKMLRAMAERYRFQPITTEQLQQLAASFLPPKSIDPRLDSFFEQWVYGTGIPTLRVTASSSGRAPGVRVKGTLLQSDVDEDFSTWVPVEALLPNKKSIVKWVQTSSEPVPFFMDVPLQPTKILLDPGNSVLAVRKGS